jgi:hypothetical protein
MELIIHRVNTIQKLKKISHEFGVEIDIRTYGKDLILNHEAGETGEYFGDFLDNYSHGTLVLNIKEAGIEDRVLEMVARKKLQSYFLLDVEMPYIYKASKSGNRNIAIRYSEYEPIELAENFVNSFEWLWIDTVTKLPLNVEVINKIKKYKTCMVCPERWGQAEKIQVYKETMGILNFAPDAIMTDLNFVSSWT